MKKLGANLGKTALPDRKVHDRLHLHGKVAELAAAEVAQEQRSKRWENPAIVDPCLGLVQPPSC